MLGVITKADYWAGREAGHVSGKRGSLKDVQDVFLLRTLAAFARRLRIAEAGGGHSRILPKLAAAGHECWNIDRLEGAGNGPKAEPAHADYRLVKVFLGEFSPELSADYFDVVCSVSVVEHIPDDEYAGFVRDATRILKSGGLFIHAIDVYLMDAGSQHRHVQHLAARLDLYRQTAALSGGALEWCEAPAIGPGLSASARWATNSVERLFKWNRIAPALREVREQADSCSLKMMLRKR